MSRFFLLLLFVLVLFISAGVVSQLKTAKKPPQIFPSDSNIQQFIDIGYNLTNSDHSRCDRCSGYFLDSNDIPVIPTIDSEPKPPATVDVCALGDCSPVKRPASGHSAVIYVVLGIKGLNRTLTYDSNHFLDDSESPVSINENQHFLFEYFSLDEHRV